MNNSNVQFAKCLCQHCEGHVEFDTNFAGETTTCPHCGLEITLSVPETPSEELTSGTHPFRSPEVAPIVVTETPLRVLYNLALKGVCFLSIIAFFLTNISISLPIVGKINVSMLDFLSPSNSQGKSEQDLQKPNIKSVVGSENGFHLKEQNLGAVVCVAAVIGLISHYALTLVWAVFAFGLKRTFSKLNLAWLALAVQFPILFSIGVQISLMAMKREAISEASKEMNDNPFASLGTALVNQISIQPGIVIWILMTFAFMTLMLPLFARKMGLPWETARLKSN